MFVYRPMSIQHSEGSSKLFLGPEIVDTTAISVKFGAKEYGEDMQDP